MYQNIYIDFGEFKTSSTVHLWDDERGYTQFPYKDFSYAYKIDSSGTRISLYGDRVKKVSRYRREDPSIIESDLPVETRVLTDLYLNSDEPAIGNRLVVFDIEVSSIEGLPKIDLADKEITSIALEDRLTGEEYVFILDPAGVLESQDHGEVIVIGVPDEETLLTRFLDVWEQITPTIITGWNIDNFDVPYLYRRIRRVLGEHEALRLSPIGIIRWRKNRQRYQIAGISALDYLDMYKKFTYTEQPNYRLDTIGQIELGIGKVAYEGSLDELFESDIKKFMEYNLRDIRIVSQLDQKKKLIDLVRGICTVGHVPYEEYGYSSRWLEGALITDLHRKGIIAPNKDAQSRQKMAELDRTGTGFVGAYVKAPIAGRYEWIYSLDLQSLYPSIIMSLNISPETKVGKVLNWKLEDHFYKKIETYRIQDLDGEITEINREPFNSFMDSGELTISSNGILYRTDQVGLLPETLDRWFNERIEYRTKLKQAIADEDEEQQEYWNMRQHIQKIFLNSLYGVLGLPVFRFYDLDNALAVTATGQDVIKTSAKYVNQHYNDTLDTEDEDYCIYIDTDSLYFSTMDLIGESDTPKEDTIRIAREQEKRLNDFYDRMAPMMFHCPKGHRFVIRGEMVASAGFWVHKKRYALRKVYDLETNQDVKKITVKGLDVVRSSFPAAFRKFMKEVLVDILDDVSKNEIDQKILDFRERMEYMPIADISRNTAVKNIGKWTKVKRGLGEFQKSTPAHVKASITHNMLLKELGVAHKYPPIVNGNKIKWIYLKDNSYKLEAVAFYGDDTDCPEITKFIKDNVDFEKIFELEFATKLIDFYNALKWGNIPTQVNQRAGEFFEF